jgi:hypothetical protein
MIEECEIARIKTALDAAAINLRKNAIGRERLSQTWEFAWL